MEGNKSASCFEGYVFLDRMSWDNFNESGDLQQVDIKPATKMVNFKDVKKGDYLEMAAYSIDLRQKILIAWQNKEGRQRELAKRFKVSLSFLRDFLRRYRETNEIAARTLLRGSPLEA